MTENAERPGDDNAEAIRNSADQSIYNDAAAEHPRSLDDAHVGARVADGHLRSFVHADAFGWMKFDGRRWTPVPETIVAAEVRLALIEMQHAEALAGADADRLKRLSALLSASKIRSIVYVAKLCRTTEETFDAHPDLLNVGNGVVDLRDGTLRPHDPALMLTKVAPVDYTPGAEHGDWKQALDALPNEDAAEWLQARLGQGLTGHPVPDDRLVVLKGSGSNGKTTVVDAVREALGPDYAVTMPDRILLARQSDHPTEMMTLRGARLALMEEFPELGHLNVKRLKDVLGTGEMTARLIAKDSVSWKPTHTPIVTTNYLPRIDESDNGTWRRLVLVDFPYRYRRSTEELRTSFDRPGDLNLRERLRQGRDGQREAVLAWLVAGAVRWYQAGHRMPVDPQCIRDSTEAWRATSDLLLRYIQARLVFDPGAHVVATELFEDFGDWLKANGHVNWSDQSFSARFANHGEIEAHGVDLKRVRVDKTGLSRKPSSIVDTPTSKPLAKQFTAWLGLRFRTIDDDTGDTGDQG